MIQIGSRYTFAPGGHAAYEVWYKTFTNEFQISGIDESDVFEVVRFSDTSDGLNESHVQLESVDGFAVNVWMPARYVGEWLVAATPAGGS